MEQDGVRFRVWSNAERLELIVQAANGSQQEFTLGVAPDGIRECFVPGLQAGARYGYRIDGEGPFPDPASRFQPDGVHSLSEVIDPAFAWPEETSQPVPWPEIVFYELHCGAFTLEGTFRAAAAKLPMLRDLGVNAIELMPVADFPGRWNWGYDGVCPYAPSRTYGRPEDLRWFVGEAHRAGLAVYLDVVYNHLGPDGAYQRLFHPRFYFDGRQNPWGDALNFDDENSAYVRGYFIGSALHWLEEYRIDGFRLDATHAIEDTSEPHFLAEFAATLRTRARELNRECRVVLEDSRNHRKLIEAAESGGYAADAVWADDLHHQIRRAIAGDCDGYYSDYSGEPCDIAQTLRKGWFYEGQDSAFLGHPRGTSSEGLPLDRFVVCIQNHDQIGNRAAGDRLSACVSPESYLAASALLLLAPETPLLFMGQEWAATSPFQYFTDHHAELGRMVTEGRLREFAEFTQFAAGVPDPQDAETFARSRLRWEELEQPGHRRVWESYRDLLRLRKRLRSEGWDCSVECDAGIVALRWSSQDVRVDVFVSLADLQTDVPFPAGAEVLFATVPCGPDAIAFQGPGCAVLSIGRVTNHA